MPQAIEVHVGAAVDRHQPFVFPTFARDELLDAGNRQRAGRLDDRAGILEYVLDGGADLIRIQQHDFVDMRAAKVERLLANTLYRDTVGKNADPVEAHAFPRLETFIHAGGVLRLDSDHPDVWIEIFHVDGDAA